MKAAAVVIMTHYRSSHCVRGPKLLIIRLVIHKISVVVINSLSNTHSLYSWVQFAMVYAICWLFSDVVCFNWM